MARLASRYALLILTLADFLVAAEVPSKLVGRWRSLETSQGGIGALLVAFIWMRLFPELTRIETLDTAKA